MKHRIINLLLVLFVLSSQFSYAVINIYLTPVNPACGNNNGRIYTIASGGTAPYSYQWSSGQVTADIDNLPPGTYTITVTDALSSTATTSATITNTPDIQGLSASYVIPSPGQGITHPCNNQCNGIAYVYVEYLSGTAPFSIYTSLSHNIGIYAPANCPTIEGICTDDNYMVYVSDALGCTGSGFGTISYPPNSFAFTSQIAPACSGMNSGSIQLDFSNTVGIPYIVTLTGPTNNQGYINSNSITFSSLLPGNYSVAVSNDYSPSCDTLFNLTVPDAGLNCGTVSGKVYADTLQNCIADLTEPLEPNRLIRFLPGPYYATSDPSGNYNATLPYGTYSAETITDYYFTSTCSVPGINLSAVTNNITGVDLGDSTQTDLDLAIYLSAGAARPGFNYQVYATIINHSFIAVPAPDVVINYDPVLSFISSNIPYTFSGPSQITLNFGAIGTFGSASALITFSIPPNPVLIGTFLNTTATLNANQPEPDITNNYYPLIQQVTGSFDPNDKSVWPAMDQQHTYLVDVDTAFNYTIRFQNTGNDTAFNVVLIDTLNSYLDITSFRMTGSSHPCRWEITGPNILKVYFENILLPDSNINEPGSHGLFSFAITHTPALNQVVFPYILENVAGIYFDFNPPVITNIAYSTIDISVGIPESHSDDFNIYPNPANESIVISSRDLHVFTKIDLFDLTGRLVLQIFPNASTTTVDVSTLLSGTYLITCSDERGVSHRQLIKY